MLQPDEAVLAPEVVAALAPLPGLAELLRFMLVRDARRRPTIPDILQRCGALARFASWACPGCRQEQPQLLWPALAVFSEASLTSPNVMHMLLKRRDKHSTDCAACSGGVLLPCEELPKIVPEISGSMLDGTCRLDALAKGTKGASKWWLPYEQPSVSGAEHIWDRPSSAVTPSGRSSVAAQDSDRAYDPDEQPSARSTASRSVAVPTTTQCDCLCFCSRYQRDVCHPRQHIGDACVHACLPLHREDCSDLRAARLSISTAMLAVACRICDGVTRLTSCLDQEHQLPTGRRNYSDHL